MENIKDNYTTNIRHFCRFIRDNNRTLSLTTIREYFIFLNTSDYTASTINTKLHAVIKRLRDISLTLSLDDLVKLEASLKLLNQDTQTKAPTPPVRVVTKDKIITPEEYDDLMAGARSDRQRLFIKFLYLTGCRISELTRILIRDVHHTGSSQGTVKIRIMGKGAKEHFIYLPMAFYEAIERTFILTAENEKERENAVYTPFLHVHRQTLQQTIYFQSNQKIGKRRSRKKHFGSYAASFLRNNYD